MSTAPKGRPSRWSLQRALLVAMIGFTVLGWLLGGALIARQAEQSTSEIHDREIRRLAQMLLALSSHEIDEMGPSSTLQMRVANGRGDSQVLGDDFRYQMWSDSGELLLTNFGDGSPAPMARLGATDYSWVNMDGETWRVYTQHEAGTNRDIQIAERRSARQPFAIGFNAHGVGLMIVSLLAVVVPAMLVLRWLMRPLLEMASALRDRTHANLEPLRSERSPEEVWFLTSALNGLFGRLRSALEREREFTAVAAHELRTPLASLRILAQLVRSADRPAERDEAIQALIESADRCAHLQEQLLTLKRLDLEFVAEMEEVVDLADLVMEMIGVVRSQASHSGVSVVGHFDGSMIKAHRFGLATLLRNLLINGVNYTPTGGRVLISTRREGNDLVIVVEDSGPGIAPEDRGRAFERFERLGLASGAGVGLGLSIVRAVADAHGAVVDLGRSTLGGLLVHLRFAGRAVAIEGCDDAAIEECADAAIEAVAV